MAEAKTKAKKQLSRKIDLDYPPPEVTTGISPKVRFEVNFVVWEQFGYMGKVTPATDISLSSQCY